MSGRVRLAQEWADAQTATISLRHLIRPVKDYEGRTITEQAIDDLLGYWAAPIQLLRAHHKSGRDGQVVQGIKDILMRLQGDCNNVHKSIVKEQGSAPSEEEQAKLDVVITQLLVRKYKFDNIFAQIQAQLSKISLVVLSDKTKKMIQIAAEELDKTFRENFYPMELAFAFARKDPASYQFAPELSGLPWGGFNITVPGSPPVPQQDSNSHYEQQKNALGSGAQIADRIARRYYRLDPERWAACAANRHRAW